MKLENYTRINELMKDIQLLYALLDAYGNVMKKGLYVYEPLVSEVHQKVWEIEEEIRQLNIEALQ